MSSTISFNGVSYSIPATADENWGDSLSAYLIALSTGALSRAGGTFTLTAETNFGATYGLKVPYIKSQASNPASAGIVRLGNTESIKWRNAANNADLDLTVNSSNALQYNGTSLTLSGSIVNADVNASAAIAYSKLALSNSIVNADVSTSAAIAYSKLALSNSIVNADVSASAAITYSKLSLSNSIVNADISSSAAIAYSKLSLGTSIVNGDISGSAAIALSKLAALTTGKALQSNASTGAIEASSVTNTELGYLSGSTGTTGTDKLVRDTSPTLVTPILGAATGTSLALGSTLNASSILDLTSTTKGMLSPRMTQAQRDAISTPATGLQIYNTNSNKLNFYNGSAWSEVGSGSSSINYIIDYDGSAIGAWTTYADAAAASPVDGTGGSPASTYAVSTDSSLRGTTNFLWTHSAANRQGEGFSYNFTIDPADKGKVIQCSFEYLIASGTYADDDLQFWIYDVTNAALIQPAPFKLKNSSIIEKFAFEFQTSSSSTSYRLIAHVATTTATAYTIRFDNWNLGPQAKLYGSPITDLISYTPVLTGATTSAISGYYRRSGDMLDVFFTCTLSSAVSGAISISIPSGMSINSTKLISANLQVLGTALLRDTGTGDFMGQILHLDSTRVYISPQDAATSSATVPFTWASGDIIYGKFSVPISGWQSSVVMSSDAATNVVATEAYRSTNQTGVNPNNSVVKIQLNAVTFDKQGAFDTTNYKYTAQTPGVYTVSSEVTIVATNVLANYYGVRLYKNGAPYGIVGQAYATVSTETFMSGSLDVELVAGDYLELYLFGNGDNSTNQLSIKANSTTNSTRLNIKRLSGPAQIAASESVNARYIANAGDSLSSTLIILKCTTKSYDTHGTYNSSTGAITFPTSGKFEVRARVYVGVNATANNQSMSLQLRTGSTANAGGLITAKTIYFASGITGASHEATFTIQALAGEIYSVQVASDLGASRALDTQTWNSEVSINRIGNY